MKSINRRRNGFSLIELLTVIAIIGILTAVSVPFYLNARKKAQIDSEGRSNLVAIQAQLEMEKQISLEKSYPLKGCVGQLLSDAGAACTGTVCDEFQYSAPMGTNSNPGFCFVVTEAPEDADGRITTYKVQAQGKEGRVVGVILEIDEDGDEPKLIDFGG